MEATRLPLPVLCLVTDLALAGGEDTLMGRVDAAIAGGVNMVQLREKHLSDEALTALALRLKRITFGRALLIVNGRPGAAGRVGADGLHFSDDDIDQEFGQSNLLIGRSVHSIAAARGAEGAGADYLIAGTVFPSRSHPGGATGGLDLIRGVCTAVTAPVIGIGGITVQNAAQVIEAGAAGIAVISAILASSDPAAEARRLAETIGLKAR